MENERLELLHEEWRDATRRAYDCLARYKFWMFGYNAARVVYVATLIHRMGGPRMPNPFRALVMLARRAYCTECGEVKAENHLCTSESISWQEGFDAIEKHLLLTEGQA